MINGSYSYGLFNVTNIETIVRPECAQHTTCTLQLAREIVNYGEINGMAITKTVATSLVNQSGNKKALHFLANEFLSTAGLVACVPRKIIVVPIKLDLQP